MVVAIPPSPNNDLRRSLFGKGGSRYHVWRTVLGLLFGLNPSRPKKVRGVPTVCYVARCRRTLFFPSTIVRVLLFIPYSGSLFPETGFAPTLSCPRCTPRIIRKPSISNPLGFGCVDLNANVPSRLLDVPPGHLHRSRSASTAAQNTRYRAQTLIRVS